MKHDGSKQGQHEIAASEKKEGMFGRTLNNISLAHMSESR
jgi:hypothetical protein